MEHLHILMRYGLGIGVQINCISRGSDMTRARPLLPKYNHFKKLVRQFNISHLAMLALMRSYAKHDPQKESEHVNHRIPQNMNYSLNESLFFQIMTL